MANDSRAAQWFSQIGDKLNEQVWYQQIKAKWDELDAQQKFYTQIGAVAGTVLFFVIWITSSLWGVHSLRVELDEKNELAAKIENASDEIRSLRESLPGGGGPAASGVNAASDAPWPPYIETTAVTAGIDKTNLNVAPERLASGGTADSASKPGSKDTSKSKDSKETDDAKNNAPLTSKESLIDISLHHVNIKQVVRFAFFLENGSRAVKVRNMTIDTKSDPTGYMDASLSVSAFSFK